MDVTLIISLAVALALVLLNGAFVAAEFAIVRVRRTRLEELAGHGREDAKRAIELVDQVDEYLATTQLGVTAASLGVGWLGASAFARLFVWLLPSASSSSAALVHVVATVLAFCLVTVTHVVLGELVPKNMAIANADRFVVLFAPPLRAVHRVLGPVSRVLGAAAGSILRRLGHVNAPPPALTEDELKLVLHDSHEDGVLTSCEAKIIHARLPLCQLDLNSVRGVVSMKEVWLLRSEDSNAAFERACRPYTTLAPDLSQEAILQRFQENGTQMGIVRDDADRKTLGIVTLEDVLESLVGDVRESRRPAAMPPL